MSQLSAEPFNYNQLEPTARQALRECAQRIGALAQNTAKNLWAMGEALSAAQKDLASYGTGTFTRWIETETGLGRTTAYRLMNVYRKFDCSNLEQTSFAPSALYLLSEPSIPPVAREEAIHRATQGEAITYQRAQEIVSAHKSRPAPPPASPSAPPPSSTPDPTVEQYERDNLRPWLRDAGIPDAPQMLSGHLSDLPSVTDESKEGAKTNLREAILEQLTACMEGRDADEVAEEILGIIGQSSGSIALAAQFGAALMTGPQTLSDLVQLASQTLGIELCGIERPAYLRLRKKVLRLLDSLTYAGALGIYEHKLGNGQITFDLLPPGWE